MEVEAGGWWVGEIPVAASEYFWYGMNYVIHYEQGRPSILGSGPVS